MSTFSPRSTVRSVLGGLLLVACAACDDTSDVTAPPPSGETISLTVSQADRDAVTTAVADIDPSWASMNAERFAANFATDARFIGPTGIVMSGRPAIQQTHTMLFGGPFRGSRRSSVTDDVLFLSSQTAVVERTVDLTNFVTTPAGLPQAQPGTVRTRERLVLQKRNGSWSIVRGQLTAVPPG
ncbi:MAG: SgcJ/EcaC family oxidoreductase [Gemmatimonadaceae bacterium]|jgi:uncharacterized protein (TIGR02246 family)|nr:SgcJ/EcaC family oxidoreductase [Gemmatimonadaceae bacterium]